MKNGYYKIKQNIGRANKNGDIIGSVERWHAHEKGELHRGFAVAIRYKGKYVVQHRKHPVFDGVFDITSSSHQLNSNGKMQDSTEAVIQTLDREWGLKTADLKGKPKLIGLVYYKAKDEKSKFIEHESCEIFEVESNKLPSPNFEYAYGYSLVSKRDLSSKKSRIYENLAPWVQKTIEEGLL